MEAPLYNAEILRLAASIPHQARLNDAHASATRSSPICGSKVTADVCTGPDGAITAFGQEVRACAFGQASAAILGQGILGQTADNLRHAHAALAGWLQSGGPLPADLARQFPKLALFAPAHPYKARHPSICLAFEAAAAAAEQAAMATQSADDEGAGA